MRYSYLIVEEEKYYGDYIFGICSSPAKAKQAIANLKEAKPQYKNRHFTIRKIPLNGPLAYEPWK